MRPRGAHQPAEYTQFSVLEFGASEGSGGIGTLEVSWVAIPRRLLPLTTAAHRLAFGDSALGPVCRDEPWPPQTLFMTSTNKHRAARRTSRGDRPETDQALVPGDQPCMQPDQDYRQLEQSYRYSAEYAAMVQRYPVLKHAIEACQHAELVSDQQCSLLPALQGPQLHWHRSHGEP